MKRRGLEIDEHGEDGKVALALTGELDIATAPRLQKAVGRLCSDGVLRRLTIDLRGLDFVDSTGLAAIVFTSKLCERSGGELALIRGQDTVQQVFALTGLLDQLPFRSAEEAEEPTGQD
ncbi:MAG TPA: STAS domain-containing protein [Solirubrobacteraceae bacterium]|nr:STAS domain-containing protein [Solirubrobacteraceae bacterium]